MRRLIESGTKSNNYGISRTKRETKPQYLKVQILTFQDLFEWEAFCWSEFFAVFSRIMGVEVSSKNKYTIKIHVKQVKTYKAQVLQAKVIVERKTVIVDRRYDGINVLTESSTKLVMFLAFIYVQRASSCQFITSSVSRSGCNTHTNKQHSADQHEQWRAD